MVKKYESIADLLREYDLNDTVWRAVHGGDINDSYALTGANGKKIFLKTNNIGKEDMFKAEAAGLRALATPGF